MDIEKLYKKAYELLLERVEFFIKSEHSKQQAIIILDNTSKSINKIVASKHAFFNLKVLRLN